MFTWLKELLELRLDYLERKKILATDDKKDEITIAREKDLCKSCETLKMQLAIANQEKEKLLNRILVQPGENALSEDKDIKPVKTFAPMWSARRIALEREKALEASQMAERKRKDAADEEVVKRESIEDVEKSIGVGNAS